MRASSGVVPPLLLVAVLAALLALGPAAGSAGAVKFTFIGDSKAAGIEFSKKAKRLLRRGHDVRRDLKVCRRLVAPSCAYQGVVPLTALEAVRHYGTDLGTVLVIDVGYNDSPTTYRRHLNRVMRAALDRGVEGVVWVNLKAVRSDYRRINRIIKRARERYQRLYLANWNKYQQGHPGWFASWDAERIHLTSPGAVGLVRLVRRYVPLAAEGPRDGAATGAVTESPPATETEESTTTTEEAGTTEQAAETETAAAELTGNSPPVGTNLGDDDGGALGLSGILPFAAGAALMLFLVFVTLKRRGASR